MPPVTLHLVDESAAIDLVSMVDAMEAVAQVFSAKYLGQAEVFPVVMAHGTDPGTRFGVKSGLLMDPPLVGLKVGTYWPGNPQHGIQAHGSTTLLLDDLSGFPRAIVAASHLTALRTAAADGVATRELSRVDAETVALIGAGHQAWYELDAVRQVRRIRRVLIWSRTAHAARELAQRVGPERVTEIGALLAGAVRGRLTESDITIFDSSGIDLQDLAVAQLALQKAKAAVRAQGLS